MLKHNLPMIEQRSKRRKLENSIAHLLVHLATCGAKGGSGFLSNSSHDSVKALLMPVEVLESDVLDNGNTSDCQWHYPQSPNNVHITHMNDPNLEAVVNSTNSCSIGDTTRCTRSSTIDIQKSALDDCSNANDSCSSSKSNMEHAFDFIKTEIDYAIECSSSDIGTYVLREPYLKKESCDLPIPCASIDTTGIDKDVGGSISCKICCCIDIPLNMLICDLCEEAFHLSCFNPRVKRIPADEWYCKPCLKKNPKPLLGIITSSKSLSTTKERCMRKTSQSKCCPISFMLEDTEPYTTGVRIGEAFQADVPNWSGPISKSSYQSFHEYVKNEEIGVLKIASTDNLAVPLTNRRSQNFFRTCL
ncbi:uncharacterized protein LOC131219382 [Magnolia sinica]|uniref:uncharacterized protein LOC131219382 n=1 Tax=Magnolia sinica TaxID=86752 RepID=UPI00265B41D8|nr:uncharacterized protein LOC131219382 [Magnolia sinica]XP_058070467.1 uncharacterized protein LOC131219382 [Magnolia sinica]